MLRQLRISIVMLIVLTLVTGVLYPLTVTLAAQVAFPESANGSLVQRGADVVGSALIGQVTYALTEDGDINNLDAIAPYFWGRPSAVNDMLGSSADAPGSSGASNYASTNARLAQLVTQREAAFRAANDVPDTIAIPSEMIYASGSGLDPHISPEAARLQIDRVAAVRGLERTTVVRLVEQYVEAPQWGIFGQPRVNVLLLNLALDQLQ
ncbi:MAG: potassium-transporting ATPase subunit KdpC [Anaerolineae bacterium]|nr:potassium-transporting ATPase subunit KdpC [Anaerolineae bacterium]